MRIELAGFPNHPLTAAAIAAQIIRLTLVVYGPLAGIENAAASMAERLVAIAANEVKYLVVLNLSSDGNYYFGVKAPRYIAERPRCRSWAGPGEYLLEVGSKRPTTYLILDDLQRRGLVSVVPRARKVLYTAESPEKILHDLHHKQELIKRFLPNMMALYNAKIDKPQVLLFEGKEAVREVYEKILSAKEVEFFSTIRDIISVYPDYPKKLNEKAVSGQVRVRELLTMSQKDLEYAQTMEHNENFLQHFAPGEGEFLTDNCLYDGNVVFFSYQPYIFAVQISSKGIYHSLRNLFEYAWQAAEPYDKIFPKEKTALV